MNASIPRAVAGENAADERQRLEVRGTVQGVGFRPFLYRLAQSWGVSGFTMNAAHGVIVEVEGSAARIAGFTEDIRRLHPVNAVVRDIAVTRLPVLGERGFRVRESSRTGVTAISVPADLATCDACLEEVFDPGNRRFLYPFTNCTDCGPRYSLIERLPYDRANTGMRHFAMCACCAAEYAEPADRRFHAEPNACPDCGPQVTLRDARGEAVAARELALRAAADAIRSGAVVAVKGLGGFQLITDARSEEAIARLRARKNRPEKPFALLCGSVEDARDHCLVSLAEEALLAGRERPIVLLRRRSRSGIADAVAPGNYFLGVMLPCTPLHHVLMAELGIPLVATSGNRAGEPIAIDNDEALRRLGGIADLFLAHDRPVLRPLDDSVARIVRGRPMLLRRARGYAATPIATGPLLPGVIALGGHLKATVALTQADGIVLGQHLGDLDSAECRDAYDLAITDLLSLRGTQARAAACDAHPDYHSTRRAEGMGVPVVRVQHHLAHVASAMAENAIEPPVLGIAWDGAGHGTDGSVWGGEFLHVTEAGCRRVAHFRRFRLPGGSAAMREPRRAAFGLLHEMFGDGMEALASLPPLAAFSAGDRQVLRSMLGRGVNAPWTTSAGRLFDVLAALLGLCQRASYEGQAACSLEGLAVATGSRAPYSFPLRAGQAGVRWIIDWEPAMHGILDDIRSGIGPALISSAFHDGLATAILSVAQTLGERRVVLSGGCFQNAALVERTVERLENAGFEPFWHEAVPPGDGGLALGQAWWAARQISAGVVPCA